MGNVKNRQGKVVNSGIEKQQLKEARKRGK